MTYLYLLINLGTIIVPFSRSFENRIAYYKQFKELFTAMTITAIFFIIWDIIFTKIGVWGFNPMYLSGIYLFDLPLGEYLFFITVPYSCMFIYANMKNFFPRLVSLKIGRIVFIILGISFFIIALLNYHRLYTFYTFLFCALFIGLTVLYRVKYLGVFVLTYAISLIPFFMVNGILTGSFIAEEVVWYNDIENLGIRLFTIPIEDVVYGMLLILMNASIFEYLQNRKFRK